MSSHKDTPDIQRVTEKQTVGDFLDTHKESAILIIALIVLLVGVLKLGHMMLNVCNDVKSTRVTCMRNFLCLQDCSKTGKLKLKEEAKKLVLNEGDHTSIMLHYDVRLSKDRAVWAHQRDDNDQVDMINVDVKDPETDMSSNNKDAALPMLVVDHNPPDRNLGDVLQKSSR